MKEARGQYGKDCTVPSAATDKSVVTNVMRVFDDIQRSRNKMPMLNYPPSSCTSNEFRFVRAP